MSSSSIFKTKGYVPPQAGGGGGSSLNNGIQAYWTLDETSGSRIDSTGNNNTLTQNNSVGSTAGKIQNSTTFDRTTNTGNLTNSNKIIPNTDSSLQCWFYCTQDLAGRNVMFVAGDYYRTPLSIILGQNTNNVNAYVTLDWGGSNPHVTTTFNINTWYHAVATNDAVNKVLKFYLNGDLIGSQSYSGTPGSNLQNGGFVIGSTYDNAGSYTMIGKVDEVGIWNRVLTQSEVTQLFAGGSGLPYSQFNSGGGGGVITSTPARILIKGYVPPTPPTPPLVTTGLTSWLDISNTQSYSGSGTTINDLSPNAGNAVMVNGPSYDSGSGGEILLNGSSQYIRTNNDLGQYYSSVNESVFIWVNPAGAGQIVTEVGYYNTTSWHDSQIEIHSDGTIHFSTWHNNSSYPQRVVSSTQQFNQWYLIGYTYDGTTLTAYINGQAIGTTNLSRNAPYYNGCGLAYYLGYPDTTNMGVNQYLNGKIGAFYSYNRSLTPTEVTQNFDATKSRYLGGGGSTGGSSSINDNLQAFWNFDEASGPRSDATGNGNTIVEVNGTVSSGSGVVGGNAANIANGNSSWLKLPAGLCDIGTGQKSFSLWFKLNQTSIGYQFILCQGHNYDFVDNNIVYIEGGSFLSSIFLTSTENHWNAYNLGGNIVPTANVWHHCVITYSGSQITAYYDGNQISQFGYSGSISTDNTEYTLGHYNAFPNGIGGQPGEFHGLIDDVGIWNRVLTPTDVAYLYNTGQGRQYPLYTPPVYIPPKFKIITRGYQKPVPQNTIITDGLILLLDASDIASYSGTGAVWNDISGSGNNFNINPAAFNSGGKYMDFKGSYGMAKNSSDINLSGDVTYICVTRILNSTGNWRTLTRAYESPGNHQVIVQAGGWNVGTYIGNGPGFRSTGYSQQSLPGYASNSFDVMCWRWTNNDNPTYDFNVNGVQRGTITDSAARYTIGFGSIGGYHAFSTNPNVGDQYWGDIKLFAVYNRRLSDAEVSQNYNALVAKFGL
jgi:hypothetical protein